MNGKIADSTALGYASLFVSTWMLSMVDAGWFTSVPHGEFYTVLILGGIIVPIAGILSFLSDDRIQGTLFVFLGALLFSYALSNISGAAGGSSAYGGWGSITIAAIFLSIWMGGKDGDTWKSLYVLGAGILFILFAISSWSASAIVHTISGYVGLVIALIAGYVAFQSLTGSASSS